MVVLETTEGHPGNPRTPEADLGAVSLLSANRRRPVITLIIRESLRKPALRSLLARRHYLLRARCIRTLALSL